MKLNEKIEKTTKIWFPLNKNENRLKTMTHRSNILALIYDTMNDLKHDFFNFDFSTHTHEKPIEKWEPNRRTRITTSATVTTAAAVKVFSSCGFRKYEEKKSLHVIYFHFNHIFSFSLCFGFGSCCHFVFLLSSQDRCWYKMGKLVKIVEKNVVNANLLDVLRKMKKKIPFVT